MTIIRIRRQPRLRRSPIAGDYSIAGALYLRDDNDRPWPRQKKAYNPVTGKWYPVWTRTTEYGKRGEIKGLWK